MSAEHVPTPWALGGKATIRSVSVPRYIATLENNSERAANAEFIIRAVNAHDDLVAALRPFVSDHPITQFDFIAYREAARAALAKAEGRS